MRIDSLFIPDLCVSIGQAFISELLTNQNISNMNIKEFLSRLMSDDETKHEFSQREKVIYGVLIPIGLVLIMGIAGWMEVSCAR